MEAWAWLLGIGASLWIIAKWFGERKQRQQTNEFMNKVMDGQINERDEAIAKLTKEQNESLEDYYKRAAEYNRKHKSGVSQPSKGND